MAAYIKASDVLADQFFLGAWGSTMPRALYLGTPAIIYVNESIHRWCFSEMPPIVNADSSDTVHAGLCRLADEGYRRELGAAGRAWYDQHHSNKIIIEGFSRAIRDVLMGSEQHRLQDAVRELRDTAAISRGLQEKQAVRERELREQQRTAFGELRDGRIASHDIQSALDTISSELQEIRAQLRRTATTIDQIGPMIPNMLRAQRLARFVFGPPFWFARYLYRRTRRGTASHGASSSH